MIYLGTPGRMVGIKCPASQNVEAEDKFSFETTLEGRRKAQVRPVGRRSWNLQTSDATTPADQAAIMGFIHGEWGVGPFVFVSADAAVSNLLTPAAASSLDLPGHAGISHGGPVTLDPGRWAGQSLIAADPETSIEIFAGKGTYPVLQGIPVTGAAWISAGTVSPAYIRLYWIDQAGGTLGASASLPVTAPQGLVRISVTATPPAGAVGVKVVALRATRMAAPTLTWSSEVLEPGPGEGCLKAVIHAGSKNVTLAAQRAVYGSVSYTVTEVG